MVLRPGLLLGVGICALAGAQARADRVVSSTSSWSASRTRIYSDIVIERADGRREHKRVPGGSVGGIGMAQYDLFATPFAGYVRSVSKETTGTPLHWARSCVFITPEAAGTTHIAGDQEWDVLHQALEHWVQRTRECGYLSFQLLPDASSESGFDRVNLVKYREAKWCRPAVGPDDEEECYASTAAALTTLFYVDKPGASDDGEILDADIELNAYNFILTVNGQTTQTGGRPRTDLANVLTHEIGHLLGLDHTCWDRGGEPALLDDAGNPVPVCGTDLPSEVTEATMYNYQENGEIKKATIEQDDIDGFCAIYALAADPGVCEVIEPPDPGAPACEGGQCAAGGRTAGGGGSLLLGVLLAGLLGRRRRQA